MAENLLKSGLMDQAETAILQPIFDPIKEIYIDSDFLYDYRLGSILLKTTNESEYKYVLSKIPEYEKGMSRSIVKYFPDLGLTDESIDLMVNDYGYQEMVHAAAPKTKFLSDLPLFITKVNTVNKTKMTTSPLRMTINSRHSPIPNKIIKDLFSYIREVDSIVRIRVTNYHSWSEVPKEDIENTTMLFVYDMVDFMSDGTSSQTLLRNKQLVDKIIMTPYQLEEEFNDPEKDKQAIENFSAVMSLYTSEFSFVRKSIPIER